MIPRRNKQLLQGLLDFVNYVNSIQPTKDMIICDPFLGSGTTALACKELGRKYIGIEISPEYCKITEDRLRQEVLPL